MWNSHHNVWHLTYLRMTTAHISSNCFKPKTYKPYFCCWVAEVCMKSLAKLVTAVTLCVCVCFVEVSTQSISSFNQKTHTYRKNQKQKHTLHIIYTVYSANGRSKSLRIQLIEIFVKSIFLAAFWLDGLQKVSAVIALLAEHTMNLYNFQWNHSTHQRATHHTAQQRWCANIHFAFLMLQFFYAVCYSLCWTHEV